MPLGLLGYDRRACAKAAALVGIDEAGRGCLAGPVVAAAVYCEGGFYDRSWCKRNSRGVDDSKRLSHERRAAIVKRFQYAREQGWIRVGIGSSSIKEIEQHNIFNANTLAMRRALEQVMDPESGTLWESGDEKTGHPVILIDGRPIRTFPHTHQGLVKGDCKSLAIALAGIHAKEFRDGIMDELAQRYPEYGFSSHRGYATEQHVQALRQYGPSPCHRPSFLKKVLSGEEEAPEVRQDSLF